jgi:hypothetical protein
VTIKQGASVNKSMLVNRALGATKSNVTLSWTSGILMTVTWPGHGQAVGNYVWISNATPSAFNGVFPVASVTDANTVVLRLARDPTFEGKINVTNGNTTITFQVAPPWSLAGYSLVTNDAGTVYTISTHTKATTTAVLTGNYTGTTISNFTRRFRAYKAPSAVSGSVLACRADEQVTVKGGAWDYNYTGGNNSGTQDTNRHLMVFGGLAHADVGDFAARDGNKYIVSAGAVTDVVIDKIDAPDHRSDIVKLYGPASNCVVSRITGISGDDVVSVQGKEPDAFAGYRYSFGDITDCQVRSVDARFSAGQGAVTVYGSDEELIHNLDIIDTVGSNTVDATTAIIAISNGTGFLSRLGAIRIIGVDGTCTGATSNAVSISSVASGEADIVIDGVIARCARAILTGSTPTVRSLVIRNCSPRDNGTASSVIRLNAITAKRVVLERCQFDHVSASASEYCYSIEGSSVIDYLEVSNSINRGNGNFLALGGTLQTVKIEGNFDQALQQRMVQCASVSGTPTILIINNDSNQLAGINSDSSCNLFFSGNRFVTMTNGVVRTSGTPTIAIRSAGNNLVSGSWVVVPSGTPVLTLYGIDIAVDPIALTGLASTLGQICFSTQATAENGLSVRGNAGWCALGGGAAGVNTLIV